MSATTPSDFSQLLSGQLPSLGAEAWQQRKPVQTIDIELKELFARHVVPSERQDLIRSLIYLWHDHLHESHSLSQDIHNRDGSFLHGIMHRREPDYWNAKYWFNRVGNHPVFPVIAERVARFLQGNETRLLQKLAPNGKWNPSAFVDLCEEATKNKNESRINLLQRVQEIELRALLEHFLGPET